MADQKPRGYASVWRKSGGKLRAAGQISVPKEALEAWLELEPNERGSIELSLVLFDNDRATSDRAPQYTGYLQVDDYKKNQKPTAAAGDDGDRDIADYSDLPF